MCRYGFKTYKSHYACFRCRRVYRQRPLVDLLRQDGLLYVYRQLSAARYCGKVLAALEAEYNHRLADLESRYAGMAYKCPVCGRPMADLGRDWRAPRAANRRTWKTVEGMYRTGHCFQTCGCNGIGPVPKNRDDYRKYLESRRQTYSRQISNAPKTVPPEEREANVRYWRERIDLVTKELKALK